MTIAPESERCGAGLLSWESLHLWHSFLNSFADVAFMSQPSYGMTFDAFLRLIHVISERSAAEDPPNAAEIRNWTRPTSCTNVRRFTGLTKFHRRFVRRCSLWLHSVLAPAALCLYFAGSTRNSRASSSSWRLLCLPQSPRCRTLVSRLN